MPDKNTATPTIIASANLATARRTIMGILGQCLLLEISHSKTVSILTSAGLPERALQEIDFPISMQQNLIICNALAQQLKANHSAAYSIFNKLDSFSLESIGVLGMAMRHADTVIQALNICLSYPQLLWGHSRLVIRRSTDQLLVSFTMERPKLRGAPAEQVDNLVKYCLTLDLTNFMQFIDDLLEKKSLPLYIHFAFAEPDDWQSLNIKLPCPVRFSQQETCFAYPAEIEHTPLPRATALLRRSYVTMVDKQSQILAEEFSISERVSRWLWAYTPPPQRAEVASLLNMSERSLTRQLQQEGSCYSTLLAQVQVERAKNFLRDPSLSVSEISNRLGYAEPAVFSRAFSRWVGISPLKWRKSLV